MNKAEKSDSNTFRSENYEWCNILTFYFFSPVSACGKKDDCEQFLWTHQTHLSTCSKSHLGFATLLQQGNSLLTVLEDMHVALTLHANVFSKDLAQSVIAENMCWGSISTLATFDFSSMSVQVQVHLRHFEYRENVLFFLSLISESEFHIHYT